MDITQNEILLIINYLEDNISENQLDDFFAWLNQEKENERFFFEIKSIYQSQKNVLDENFDVNESWVRMQIKVEEKLNREKILKKKKQQLFSPNKRIYAYAAAFVGVIILSSVYFLTSRIEQPILQTFRYDNQIGSSSLYLPDGTLVKLASNSKVAYKSDYGEQSRTVILDGEALFEVVTNRKCPFIVESGKQRIEVLGTKFNVQAYDQDSLFITTLLEGSVKMSSGTKKIILKPGEQTVFNTMSGTVNVQEFSESEVLSWTSGYYIFSRKPLPLILNRMGKVYGVDFVIESPEVYDEVLSGTFYQGQDLDNFLKVLKPVSGFKYDVRGKKIIVSKK